LIACRFSNPSSRLKQRAEYYEDGLRLGLLLKRDAAMKTEFEATSFRLKNLEQELSWMRKNIQERKDNLVKHTCNNIISSCNSDSFRILRLDKHFESMRCTKKHGD